MKIDAHAHISLYEDNAKDLESSFELLQEDMKSNGIDYVIVIPDNIEGSKDIADLDKAIELIGDKKNFFLLGSPQIIQRGISEVEKYRKLLINKKIIGIKFFPGHDPYYPTDERCLPYFEICQEFDAPILIHTGENSDDSDCAKWNDPKYIVEIAKKYPKLKIIIAHYFWPKMDYCFELTKDYSNIYFDTSAMADDEVIEKSGGIDKVKEILEKTIENNPNSVIFGTDWPMCKTKKHIELIESLSINKMILEDILYNNAIKIYNLNLVK